MKRLGEVREIRLCVYLLTWSQQYISVGDPYFYQRAELIEQNNPIKNNKHLLELDMRSKHFFPGSSCVN